MIGDWTGLKLAIWRVESCSGKSTPYVGLARLKKPP